MRASFYACAHHMCIVTCWYGNNGRHGVKTHCVRVLEEDDAIEVILLNPLIDDFVLPMSDTKRSYSIQTQVNVTMSMRLSDDVTWRVTCNLSLNVTDCRNAILHRNIPPDRAACQSSYCSWDNSPFCNETRRIEVHLVVILRGHDSKRKVTIRILRTMLNRKDLLDIPVQVGQIRKGLNGQPHFNPVISKSLAKASCD